MKQIKMESVTVMRNKINAFKKRLGLTGKRKLTPEYLNIINNARVSLETSGEGSTVEGITCELGFCYFVINYGNLSTNTYLDYLKNAN